ncbi:MAG: peptidoglycan editing factor PgeF [Candidatus Caldatribacteriota bacterium]|nr:peptidoglycan editing factor PgeF [Candidatus Caldatribacteriota bacterium]
MKQNFELIGIEKIKYIRCRRRDFSNLTVNAFTTRLGGISENYYKSLNLSFNVNDKESYVLENRKRILDILDIDYRKIVSAQQIHKDRITVVERGDEGKGAFKYLEGISGSDALITNKPGIPLLMCYADCVPIIILDPIKKAIGLIHGGRRGTQLKIAFKTIIKMKQTFGTEPNSCLAAIFPSIGPCCYNFTNQEEIIDWLNEKNIYNKIVVKKEKNSWSIDLRKANYLQLIKSGMKTKNIFISEKCTADNHELFFSHHRDNGRTGRMAAIFMLKENRKE